MFMKGRKACIGAVPLMLKSARECKCGPQISLISQMLDVSSLVWECDLILGSSRNTGRVHNRYSWIMEERDPQTFAFIGAAMEVHAQLGHGFLESVYHEAFMMELTARGIPFRQEVQLPVYYKERRLTTSFRCDFICFDDVVIEIKAISTLTSADDKQILNYLTATRIGRGLVVNFGSASLQYKRRVKDWKGL